MLKAKKIGMNFICSPLIGRYPQTCLKLGGTVTQTSVVDVLVTQSARARAIYYTTGNYHTLQ